MAGEEIAGEIITLGPQRQKIHICGVPIKCKLCYFSVKLCKDTDSEKECGCTYCNCCLTSFICCIPLSISLISALLIDYPFFKLNKKFKK